MKNYSLIAGLSLLSLIILFNTTTDVAYAQQGTPFLQEEIDQIIEIIEGIQDQLDNISVTWANIDNKPLGFADDVDNDKLMEISTSCTVDQIVKWDGVQWNCADSAENDEGGEVALRKLDCLLVSAEYSITKSFDFQEGCNLQGLDVMEGDNLSNLNLSFAILSGNVFFDATDLANTDFSYADLADASFDVANATGADFTGANLSGVEFYDVDLTGADFTGANLSNVDFTASNLTGAVFTGATNSPTGIIACIGTPTDAGFTCTD